jgi:hypothetical protein
MRAKLATRLVSALAIFPLYAAVAQVPSGDSSAEKPPGVTVIFFATDKQGNPIHGLEQSDISILDNKLPPQSIMAFRDAKELPLRLGIVIECGLPWWEYGSEFSKHPVKSDAYEDAARAALDFLSQVLSGPDDKAFITNYATISDGLRFMTRDEILKLTPDMILPKRPQPRAIERKVTWTYDAIILACAAMQSDREQPARRILIIVGDSGQDWARTRHSHPMSKAGYKEAAGAALRSGTMILGVGNEVAWLAPRTGGYSERLPVEHSASGSVLRPRWSDFPKAFENVKTQMDNMYSVTYIPTYVAGAVRPGQFRCIELKITTSRKWKAHAPAGYYVSASAR